MTTKYDPPRPRPGSCGPSSRPKQEGDASAERALTEQYLLGVCLLSTYVVLVISGVASEVGL